MAACERSIQVHGGIGFTWEHPLHRFYKRALWLEGFGLGPRAPARGRGHAPWGGLGETLTVPQERAERRDSSLRSSAGYVRLLRPQSRR